MADNIYIIDQLATRNVTVITDDGSGIDWLEFTGPSYIGITSIRLNVEDASGEQGVAVASYTTIFPVYPKGYTFANAYLSVKGLIENARGTNGFDSIEGNEVGNILYGDHASTGLGGEDYIDGGSGNDTIYGGSANDRVRGDAENDLLYGDAGADSIYGGRGNDTVYGGSENDLIDGKDGSDVLRGDAGNDTINALDSFNDTVVGGAGADSMTGSWTTHDMISYAGSNAGVNVELLRMNQVSIGHGGHAEGDIIAGFSDFTGSSYNDIVETLSEDHNDALATSNRFYGGGGNDQLFLGDGADTGSGGAGNDYIDLGIGADRGDGGAGNDFIAGDDGNDSLYGGAGNDTLMGDSIYYSEFVTGRVDRLYGGLGADSFLFDDRNFDAFGNKIVTSDRDIIQDFNRAEADHIDLTYLDADLLTNSIQESFVWIGSAAFSAKNQLRVVNSGTNTLVQADLNGDLVADFSILVMGINNMIQSDFTLI